MGNVTGNKRFMDGVRANLAAASTAQVIPNHGTTTLPTTGGTQPVHHLAAPVVGCRKVIFATGGSTGQTVTSTGASAFMSSTGGSTHQTLLFLSIGASVTLEGLSTGLYGIVGMTGAVAFS